MSSIFSYSNSNSSDLSDQKEETETEKPPPKNKKRSCPCNVLRCKKCHPNQPKLTKKEIERIKELNNKRTKPRALKYCQKECKSCKNYCERANYYIEQEILKYYLKGMPNTNQENNNQEIGDKEPNQELPGNEEEQIELADHNKEIDVYFDLIKINGNGNCLFKSILESLNIEQAKHKILREIAAKSIEERKWDQNVLEGLKINSPKELADKVRQEDSFVGETAISSLAEKLGITIAIYLKDTTQKWIKENDVEGQDIIYLEYCQGKYANLDLEGHYNSLKPKIQYKLKSKEKIIELIEETNKEIIGRNILKNINVQQITNNKIKILLWNIQSIRNYTKRLFLTQLLVEEDIHIALLQETFLTQEDKIFIKGYRIYRSNGNTHRKGVAVLISENLLCDKYITYKDSQGRFLKIKLKTPEDRHITISNIYIEPDMKNHPEIIPEEIIEGDIIGGDLNKMETTMDKDGVYQTKNIGEYKKRTQQPKGTSDHYILIYEKYLPIKIETTEKIKIIQDKNIIENNCNSITNFLTQKSNQIIINNPNKKIKINLNGLKTII